MPLDTTITKFPTGGYGISASPASDALVELAAFQRVRGCFLSSHAESE